MFKGSLYAGRAGCEVRRTGATPSDFRSERRDMWQDEPVATAREIFGSSNRAAWSAPLVRWLRERSPNLALDWVFRITRALLPQTCSANWPEMLGELDRLEYWRREPPPSTIFKQKVHELWYLPDRDIAQTAIAHLYASLAQAVCPELRIEGNWLWRVPSLLSRNSFYGQLRREIVEWCIADFETFVAGFGPQGPC